MNGSGKLFPVRDYGLRLAIGDELYYLSHVHPRVIPERFNREYGFLERANHVGVIFSFEPYNITNGNTVPLVHTNQIPDRIIHPALALLHSLHSRYALINAGRRLVSAGRRRE
jgi:hypothetical protein